MTQYSNPDLFRVVVLCSHRAPGLVEALAQDPNRGLLYDVVAVVSSEDKCADSAALERLGISVVQNDIRGFCRERRAQLSDHRVRQEYDAATLQVLALFAPDLILCCGYLYVLSDLFLQSYAGPIVNLHHSDLCVQTQDGGPNYPGLRAVRDAVIAGAAETRSTAHLVTSAVDAGPPLVRTWAFPISPLVAQARGWGAIDILKAYAYAHQEWMLRASWPALIARTIELFAMDRIYWQTLPPRIDGREAVLDLEEPAFVVGAPHYYAAAV
jgi:phosphoribosylglycinamide formyltransferase-1